MRTVGFVKAEAAGNDFLVVDAARIAEADVSDDDLAQFAARICSRRIGVGADGLEVVSASSALDADFGARLWNSDGSPAEISGNGTRCVAAYLTEQRLVSGRFSIATGAGARDVELVSARPPRFEFRMRTDEAECRVMESALELKLGSDRQTVTTVDVGNPQCVCRVESFGFDWQARGAALESHPHFPDRTNVSFVRVEGGHEGIPKLEVRFWERGVGPTLSSGTGSLGAAVAARHHGWIRRRAEIRTDGGEMLVDWDDGIGLTGPVRIIARGDYLWEGQTEHSTR